MSDFEFNRRLVQAVKNYKLAHPGELEARTKKRNDEIAKKQKDEKRGTGK